MKLLHHPNCISL